MYTTKTATRDFALKAAAAAERAMERHACSKSQFKFKCFSCGEMIHRGDKITRCNRAATGMTLRYRGADSHNGLTMAETTFYQANTGNNMWVHIGCIPCYWDSLPPTSNEYSRPSLRPICTDWGVKVYGEWEEWANADDSWGGLPRGAMGVPYFCMVKGYPKEKFMRDRIVHAVTRFQALWRGYIYKKAYPVALLQAQAEQMYPPEMEAAASEEVEAALAYRQQTCWEEECREADILRENWLWSGEGGKKEQEEPEHAAAGAMFNWLHQIKVGDHGEILMDYKKKKEAIYSCEIIKKEMNGGENAYIIVKYHYDGEVRRYYWRRYIDLFHECKNFKLKKKIEAKIIGKLPTGRLY